MEDIQLNGHYWDESNKVYKYKIEYNKARLKTSKMQETIRRDKYKNMKYYWNVRTDETERPNLIRQLNTNTFYKFNINILARRVCQLVSRIQFMSGIEWTSVCVMLPCLVLDQLNILIL